MSKPFRAETLQLGPNIWFLQGAAAPDGGGGVVAPVGSLYWRTGTFELYQKVDVANTAWVFLTARDLFGTGVDGTAVIGAGTTTLARDTYYNDLTIQNTGILRAAGFRIFVRGTLTIDVGGTLSASGGAGAATLTGGTAGTPGNGSIVAGGPAGGNGGTAAGSNGGNGTGCPQGFVGAGGGGGAGSGGAGGTGGIVSMLAANSQGNPFAMALAMVAQVGGTTVTRVGSGAGGGGGGGDGTAGGGGGGSGGGLFVFARSVLNNGSIQANGGAGGTPAAGNRGGGGGGGGGLIVLGTHAFVGTTPTVAAGAAGAGSGTGVGGVNGVAGMLVSLAL